MKLKCKCGNILTKDLYPTKTFSKTKEIRTWVGQTPEDEIEYEFHHFVKEGTVILSNTHNFLDYNSYSVCLKDCIGINFIPFKDGYGCCNNHSIPVSCKSCNVEIGYEFSDCYDAKCVILTRKIIRRCYK